MKLNSKFISVNEIKLHYVESEPETKSSGTIIFLHGFPEYWGSWHEQLAFFGKQYRVIAPDLMGYNLSDKPEILSAYEVPNLIALYASFVEQVSPSEMVILVAHDWGGAIAWPLAAFHSQLFSSLVILNAAHPSTFTREMVRNKKQREKSAYIHQLIADDGSEVLEQDDFQFLRSMLFEQMKVDSISSDFERGYLRAWKQPGAIQAMLNYYKSMPQLAIESESSQSGPLTVLDDIKIPNIRITLPTLVLWGEQDKAFVPELLDGLDDYVPDLQIKCFFSATHWLHHEKPLLVNKEIEAFLKRKNGLK